MKQIPINISRQHPAFFFFGFLRCGRHFKTWKRQFLHPHQICLDAFLCLRPPHLSEFDDFSGTDGKPLESLCNIRHWPLRCSALFGPEKLLVVSRSLVWGGTLLFQPPSQFAGRPTMYFPFLWLCPVRPLYPAPEASRTADVGELRQSARELASFFLKTGRKRRKQKTPEKHVVIGCYWLIRLTLLTHLTQFTLASGSTARVKSPSNKAHIGSIDLYQLKHSMDAWAAYPEQAGKFRTAIERLYIWEVFDSWLDLWQWNWQYNYHSQ